MFALKAIIFAYVFDSRRVIFPDVTADDWTSCGGRAVLLKARRLRFHSCWINIWAETKHESSAIASCLSTCPPKLQISLRADGKSHVRPARTLLWWLHGIKVSQGMRWSVTCSATGDVTSRGRNGGIDYVRLWCRHGSWLSAASSMT